jgi:hypothetical protein
MSKPITKALAQKALTGVRRQFKYALDPKAPQCDPILRKGEYGHWEIVWEEGPYEWVHTAFSGGFDEELYGLAIEAGATPEQARKTATVNAHPCPDGVFAEAATHYSLGLYPAH